MFFARRWDVPYRDVEEAIMEHDLGTAGGFQSWSAGRFKYELEVARGESVFQRDPVSSKREE